MVKNNDEKYSIISNNPLNLYDLNLSQKKTDDYSIRSNLNNFNFSNDFYEFLLFLEKKCNFDIYSRVLKNDSFKFSNEFDEVNESNFLVNLVFEYVSTMGSIGSSENFDHVENEYSNILFGIFYPDVSDEDRDNILDAVSINKTYYVDEYYGDYSYRNCSIIDLNSFYKILKIMNKTTPDISFIEKYNKKSDVKSVNKFKKMLEHTSNELEVEGFSRNGLIKKNKI